MNGSYPPQDDPASDAYTSSTGDKTRYELEAAKEYAEMVVNTIREGLLVLDLGLRVKTANRSFYSRFETAPEETEGRLIYELGNGSGTSRSYASCSRRSCPRTRASTASRSSTTSRALGGG